MNDQQLKTLISVAELGSFGKAEEFLFLSKQAIRKQIDTLEKELGFTLLVRTRQGIALTAAGSIFLTSAKNILNEIQTAKQSCYKLLNSDETIRIVVPHHPKVLLENAFVEFSKRFPNVQLQVSFQPGNMLVDDVINNRADVAECILRPGLDRLGLRYLELAPMPYQCLMMPNHPLAEKEKISPEDLRGIHIGVLFKNPELISYLSKECPGIDLELFEDNDVQRAFSLCFSGGVYVSKAYYISSMDPLITKELDTDIAPREILLYRSQPSDIVKEFVNVVRALCT